MFVEIQECIYLKKNIELLPQPVSACPELWEDGLEETLEGDVEDCHQYHRESGGPASNEWCLGKAQTGTVRHFVGKIWM